METVFIEYIGKQKLRVDNIRNSGRIWNGPGAVIELPLVERYSYLQYPTMFREITRDEWLSRQAAKEAAVEGFELVLMDLPRLPIESISNMIVKLQEELERREVERQSQPPVAPITDQGMTLAQVAEAGTAEAAAAYQTRLNKIMAAIRELDPKNGEHFTDAGQPRLSAVAELTGFIVKREEVTEASKLLG